MFKRKGQNTNETKGEDAFTNSSQKIVSTHLDRVLTRWYNIISNKETIENRKGEMTYDGTKYFWRKLI